MRVYTGALRRGTLPLNAYIEGVHTLRLVQSAWFTKRHALKRKHDGAFVAVASRRSPPAPAHIRYVPTSPPEQSLWSRHKVTTSVGLPVDREGGSLYRDYPSLQDRSRNEQKSNNRHLELARNVPVAAAGRGNVWTLQWCCQRRMTDTYSIGLNHNYNKRRRNHHLKTPSDH